MNDAAFKWVEELRARAKAEYRHQDMSELWDLAYEECQQLKQWHAQLCDVEISLRFAIRELLGLMPGQVLPIPLKSVLYGFDLWPVSTVSDKQ